MIKYTVEIKSDAQIGSGLGGELVNSLVTRDGDGRPVIRASHVKGILRQTLHDIFLGLGWSDGAIDVALGAPGWRPALAGSPRQAGGGGAESQFQFSDAVWAGERSGGTPPVRLISRTAIDATTGTVLVNSLRTDEAVASGSRFEGRITGHGTPADGLLVRLGLLSIRAVGGGRNRGGGCCVVSIEGEERSPGTLLLEVDRLRGAPEERPRLAPVRPAPTGNKTAWFDVVFLAEDSVLCPERPETLNQLRSGIAIAASAVQGLVLHTLDRWNTEAAGACFHDGRFRAWPLQPCGFCRDDPAQLAWPVGVSITHKTAKIISDPPVPDLEFADAAVEPYDWEKRPPNAPILKSTDGVLLLGQEGRVRLWKAGDMPRVFSTHGVHSDRETPGGRNLYSVEAMGALAWRGLLACPEELAAVIAEKLHDSRVSLGKSRSVRGSGRLRLRRLSDGGQVWAGPRRIGHGGIFIAQSPIALPPEPAGSGGAGELQELAQKWAATHGMGKVEAVWETVGLRFGWNRHGAAGAMRHGRVPASRVILPGAVIRLEQPREDIAALAAGLLAGIGPGRERGFGCLLPHPGKASALFTPARSTVELPVNPQGPAIERAFALAGTSHLSASQIGALRERLAVGREAAVRFLDQQVQRGSDHWQDWQSSARILRGWVQEDAAAAGVSLDVLRDLLDGKGK